MRLTIPLNPSDWLCWWCGNYNPDYHACNRQEMTKRMSESYPIQNCKFYQREINKNATNQLFKQ
jgi:hypothetical protein